MADVILIDPPINGRNLRPQLGTLHLAAMLLQSGYNPVLIDFTVAEDPYGQLERLLRLSPICVGISTVIGPMIKGGLEVAAFVRSRQPTIPIVWGGVHPTTASETTITSPLVDAVCLGVGEVTYQQMVKAYQIGASLDNVPGVLFKRNSKVIQTPPRTEFFDLDQLPSLPYHLVDLARYRVEDISTIFFGLTGKSALSLETSRSCAYRCEYCVNAAKREKFRTMSTGKVLAHLSEIVKLGIDNITINDDNFFVDKPRAMEILGGIVANGWKIGIFVAVRSDTLKAFTEDEWCLVKKAGVGMFGIGVESGSNRVLESIRKAEHIEDTFQANQQLAAHGIRAWIHFLYGFPGEKLEDVRQTHAAMKRVLNENPYALVNLNRLIPNPGTPSFKKCVACGWPAPTTLDEWSRVIDDTRNRRPEYLDPEIERYWKEHFQGILFPAKSLAKTVPPITALLEAYLAKSWELWGRKGAHGTPLKILVFGAGRHTAWLETISRGSPCGPTVVEVVDDNADKIQATYWGKSVIVPAKADLSGVHLIVLSTYYSLNAMDKRCREIYGERVPIVNLYDGLPDGLNPNIP